MLDNEQSKGIAHWKKYAWYQGVIISLLFFSSYKKLLGFSGCWVSVCLLSGSASLNKSDWNLGFYSVPRWVRGGDLLQYFANSCQVLMFFPIHQHSCMALHHLFFTHIPLMYFLGNLQKLLGITRALGLPPSENSEKKTKSKKFCYGLMLALGQNYASWEWFCKYHFIDK